MTRTLGRNHDHVNIFGWNDGLEVNAEPVRNPQNLSRMQVVTDGSFIEFRLGFIGGENLYPVRPLGRFRWRDHRHSIGPRLLRRGTVGIQPDNYLEAAVAQVLRLCVSLAAVSDHSNGLILQSGRISVLFVISFGHE